MVTTSRDLSVLPQLCEVVKRGLSDSCVPSLSKHIMTAHTCLGGTVESSQGSRAALLRKENRSEGQDAGYA